MSFLRKKAKADLNDCPIVHQSVGEVSAWCHKHRVAPQHLKSLLKALGELNQRIAQNSLDIHFKGDYDIHTRESKGFSSLQLKKNI